MFVKINGTMVNKQKHLLQISLRELHNDRILPSSGGGFFGENNIAGNICIGDTSLSKYTPKYIKLMSNRNKITFV